MKWGDIAPNDLTQLFFLKNLLFTDGFRVSDKKCHKLRRIHFLQGCMLHDPNL